MCTAISDGTVFGRTLDLEYTLDEKIITSERGSRLKLIHGDTGVSKYEIRGCGIVRDGVNLYYDAANECGLAIAALNFPNSAVYKKADGKGTALASFEVIPAVLSNCKSLSEAKEYLSGATISDESFSSALPSTGLHWIIADKTGCAVLEPLEDGARLYENPFRILTNEPPFLFHKANAAQYMHLDSKAPKNTLCPNISLTYLSHGLGAIGIPGDNSSPSRFIRALYNLTNTLSEEDTAEKINRFFHIAKTVFQPNGTSYTPSGKPIKTVYTVCYDLENFEIYLRKH